VPRSRTRTGAPVPPKIPADPALLSTDLKDWAGERIASSGRREALLGRVELLRMAADGRSIEARVRGNRPLPYQVHIQTSQAGLLSSCTCAKETLPACKHAVAALEALRFPLSALPRDLPGRKRRPAGRPGRGKGRIVQHATSLPGFLVLGGPERTLTREERVAIAREEEVIARRTRARRDRAAVTQLPAVDGPLRFSVADRNAQEPFLVTMRGRKAGLGSCTCSDFSGNELQTCRHVERVRSWFSRKKKQIPSALLSLWWQPRAWTGQVPDPLEEIRIDPPEGEQSQSLNRYFRQQGWLRPSPEEQPRHTWAREAVDVARRVARRRGWVWDLDEAVEQKIEAAFSETVMSDRLFRITPNDRAWREIIPKLGFTLHPYQELGALFLARKGRALLADEMGLGKTLQAVVATLLLRRLAGAKKALVVCPASLKHQWRREIEKACGELATVVEGARPTRLALYREWRSGFLILNYELILRDLDALRAASADLVILDEAQRIKNWDTKTAKAVKQLHSPYAFILTGTPLENRLIELHSLVEFLYPRALGPRWRVVPFHAVTESPGRVIAYEGLEVLRARMRGFFLRRDRQSVLDQLPERTDNTYWTGMTAAQRKPYARHAAMVGSLLSQNQPLRPGEVKALLQALTSMRILCNARAQYDWRSFADRLKQPGPPTRGEIKALGSPKLEEFARVLEDLLDESDAKIVVFSQWERMLRLAHFVVRDLLERRDLRADVFYGALNSRARDEMLEEFRIDPEFRVLLSTDAGGLGLNLQEAASIVVNLEVPWNPAVLEQRIGRVHRMGQKRSVQVLHFVTARAIEERVRHVLESKRALFEGLLADTTDTVIFEESSRSTFMQKVRSLIGDGD
jgi:superfamily II DNA or RNA helicase